MKASGRLKRPPMAPPLRRGGMRRTLRFNRDATWRRRAVRQRLGSIAPADAAGCRVYEEEFLRAMSIYGRITAAGVFGGRASPLFPALFLAVGGRSLLL